MKQTYANAVNEIESAIKRAGHAHKSVAYGHFLRLLPDFVVEAALNTFHADEESAAIAALITYRVGWRLHGRKTKAYDPGDEEVVAATERIVNDLLLESLRRQGYLSKFDPAPDPFIKGGRVIELSESGRALDDAMLVVIYWLAAGESIIL